MNKLIQLFKILNIYAKKLFINLFISHIIDF